MKIKHCVIFMTSYKQIFPLYTIDTTTKKSGGMGKSRFTTV